MPRDPGPSRTRLSQLGFRSRLKTWVYRLAINHILDLKKSPIERQHLSFDAFADNLVTGQVAASATNTEQSMLIDEVKVGCSLAMLQCLDRPHRIALLALPGIANPGRRRDVTEGAHAKNPASAGI